MAMDMAEEETDGECFVIKFFCLFDVFVVCLVMRLVRVMTEETETEGGNSAVFVQS